MFSNINDIFGGIEVDREVHNLAVRDTLVTRILSAGLASAGAEVRYLTLSGTDTIATASVGETVVDLDGTGGVVDITLPPATAGQTIRFYVKSIPSGRLFTFRRAGSDLIDSFYHFAEEDTLGFGVSNGASSFSLTFYGNFAGHVDCVSPATGGRWKFSGLGQN